MLSLAVQCIVIGPVCLQRAGVVCGSVTTITRDCVHRSHQTGSVGEGSDHLQPIIFWPSCAPGNGVCNGAKIFGFALLQPVRSVCISPRVVFSSCCSCCVFSCGCCDSWLSILVKLIAVTFESQRGALNPVHSLVCDNGG